MIYDNLLISLIFVFNFVETLFVVCCCFMFNAKSFLNNFVDFDLYFKLDFCKSLCFAAANNA